MNANRIYSSKPRYIKHDTMYNIAWHDLMTYRPEREKPAMCNIPCPLPEMPRKAPEIGQASGKKPIGRPSYDESAFLAAIGCHKRAETISADPDKAALEMIARDKAAAEIQARRIADIKRAASLRNAPSAYSPRLTASERQALEMPHKSTAKPDKRIEPDSIWLHALQRWNEGHFRHLSKRVTGMHYFERKRANSLAMHTEQSELQADRLRGLYRDEIASICMLAYVLRLRDAKQEGLNEDQAQASAWTYALNAGRTLWKKASRAVLRSHVDESAAETLQADILAGFDIQGTVDWFNSQAQLTETESELCRILLTSDKRPNWAEIDKRLKLPSKKGKGKQVYESLTAKFLSAVLIP